MDAISFTDASSIESETGLVFGEQGTEYLEVAIVFSAVNLSALKKFDVKAVRIKTRDDLKAAGQASKNLTGGFVFYGLNEYLQSTLKEICGEATPQQADWGEAARRVSNDLIELADICKVLYVTCDVVTEEKKDKPPKRRFSLNPGTEKIILGYLDQKIYVGVAQGKRAVQDEPYAALAFRLAPAKQETSDKPKRELA